MKIKSDILKNISLTLALIFLIGCSSEKDLLKDELNLALANKDHYQIILISKNILDLDPKDVEAISAYRESIRVYQNLKLAAEALMKVESTNFLELEDINLDDTDQFIEYAKYYYFNHLTSEKAVKKEDQDTEESKKAIFSMLNNISGCTYGDTAKDLKFNGVASEVTSPSDCLREKLNSFLTAKKADAWIENYKNSIKYLVEAKEYFEKAEKLDPRFRGVIDMEEYLEDRAEIFSGTLHYLFLSFYSSITTSSLSLFDSFYSLTNTTWDTYSSLNSYYSSYSVSDAYSSAKNSFDSILGEIYLNAQDVHVSNIKRVGRLYSDLDDEFDIKSLKSAEEITESISIILEYSFEAKGSLRDWYSLLEDAAEDYIDSIDDFIDEVDWEDFIEGIDALETGLENYLDPELIEAYEAYPDLV
tara:strand:- start:522 stop:1772 length:1251 start_codon:yes stop_codon:yes gene_type:complete